MLSMRPWLSVVIPTFNGAAFLGKALDSLVAQKDDDLEVIAVDDGSTDGTVDILRSYTHSLPLRLILRKHTGNWVTTTNLGLSVASGAYVSFLHQDDVWLPNRLKDIRGLLGRWPRTILLMHPCLFIDATDRKVGIWRCPLPKNEKPLSATAVLPKLLVHNFVTVSAPCFLRQAAKEVGLLDDRLWFTADWKFWLQLSALGESLYYPQPLSCFRIHSSSLSAMRSSTLSDLRNQMQTMIDDCLPLLSGCKESGNSIRRMSAFSVEITVALAAAAWRQPIAWENLVAQFLALGPGGWFRYLHYSRIFERSVARIRAGLTDMNRRAKVAGLC